MLNAVVDYLPSPLDIPSIKGIIPDTNEDVERHANDDEPFSALAFKVMTDPYVGKLTFFRVYSGTLQSDLCTELYKGNVSGLGVFCKCTQITVKKFRKFMPATLLQRLV